MKIICTSPYRTRTVEFNEGDEIEDTDERCEFLLRDAPGSFKVAGKAVPVAEDTPDLSAMSTETETGIVAPDRRARGGAKR